MRYDGAGLDVRFAGSVQLPRPAGDGPIFRLQPLPIGFEHLLMRHQIAAPQPPQVVARDSQSRPLRQPDGRAVLMADEQDAGYRAALVDHERRVAALMVATSLQADERVQFVTTFDPHIDDWRPSADAVWKELEEAGFSAGDLAWLTREICRLSNLIDQHLATARADFFSEGRAVAR